MIRIAEVGALVVPRVLELVPVHLSDGRDRDLVGLASLELPFAATEQFYVVPLPDIVGTLGTIHRPE